MAGSSPMRRLLALPEADATRSSTKSRPTPASSRCSASGTGTSCRATPRHAVNRLKLSAGKALALAPFGVVGAGVNGLPLAP